MARFAPAPTTVPEVTRPITRPVLPAQLEEIEEIEEPETEQAEPDEPSVESPE
jgi:hypothetical protein